MDDTTEEARAAVQRSLDWQDHSPTPSDLAE
ncbi:MAG: hypothetical protein QOC82_1972 [Frankiaceae bacterium]|jgi:hypothetical protein|nr:hypothetical protein [Frankiaceae bacterium]MDQ1699002.1 hypothetical protein [Frankiaceae bacterium]